MILSHGASGGLDIAFSRTLAGLGEFAIYDLREMADDVSDAAMQQRLPDVPIATVRGIVDRARRARAMSLGAVVKRACNLGRYDNGLRALMPTRRARPSANDIQPG